MELKPVFLALVMIVIVGNARGDSGFLVTAPQQFISGSTEKVCATFFDLREKILIIKVKQGSDILAEESLPTVLDNLCLDIKVPDIAASGEKLQLILEANVMSRSSVDGAPFLETREKNIHLLGVNKIQTFIQTDKPIYKAGQTVKFRILALNYPNLKPHIGHVRRVYIEEAGGRRIQQWNDVPTRVGLAELELLLSAEPPLGIWTIIVEVRSGKIRQTFEVGEYVLPKFSVKVTPHPAYVLRSAETVNVEICAEYSYGEPVKGSIEANFTLKNLDGYGIVRHVVTLSTSDTGSDGCHTFSINSTDLEVKPTIDFYLWRSYKLYVAAAFTEHGTDVTMTETGNVASLEREVYRLVIEGPDNFKPGLPYHGRVRLTYPDSYPVSSKVVLVKLKNNEGGESFEKAVSVTITNGVGSFIVPPPRNAANTKIIIEAITTAYEGTNNANEISATKTLQAWYSPSGNFLQVVPMPKGKQNGMQDNIRVDFTVPADQESITFYYKIISRGNIVLSGQQEWTVSEIQPPQGRSQPFQRVRRGPEPYSPPTVEEPDLPTYTTAAVKRISFHPFTVSANMAPSSNVIVYYVRDDGEVVSASGRFTVGNIFENQVTLDFNTAEARPGAPMQLTVNAAPLSLCALGVVDKSVHLLRDSNQLTANKVKNPLQSFNTHSSQLNPSYHCSSNIAFQEPQWRFRRNALGQLREKRGSPRRFRPQRNYFSRHLDTIEAFKNAGMVVISNFEVETRPCYVKVINDCPYCDIVFYSRQPDVRGVPGPGGSQNSPNARGGPMGPMGPDPRFEVEDMPVAAIVPDLETDEPSAESPLVEIRSYFPETWLWELAVTSDSGSANISSKVPHTITDWVANGFCTSAENGFGIANPVDLRAFQPFFLSYNLPYSAIREEKIPVTVTVFNYLAECFTVKLSIVQSNDFSLLDESPNQYVCVCDRESKTVNYTIIPRALGEVKITVHGSYVTPGFNVPFCGNNALIPSATGVRDAIEDILLVEPEGVEREETFSEMVCVEEGDDFSAVVPLNLPADVISDSARGKVFVTGDLMGSVLSNLGSILQMPTGCGEQNMIKFAPNIYVLQYLTGTDQLTRELETKALEFLRIGYQRELKYRLSDASYSAFGESDGEGSTWLTAFVLKSYVQADMFINIDIKDIVATQKWLLSQQDAQTGCFQKRGQLRHQSMKGGVSDEVTLTAYVLTALLEAGVPRDSKVEMAVQCISARLTEVYDDPYALALVTYALMLVGNSQGEIGLVQLDILAQTRTGGIKYWKRFDTEVVETDCYYNPEPAASVEMTSYALLAYMASREKDLADAIPIVRWLNQQRSALGGYSSTQDTVMGLQSLSSYASKVYSNSTNMAIDVSKSDRVFLNRFVLNAANQILLQRMEIDEVPTTLSFEARGIGCALVQAQLRYNIPAVRSISRDPFEITLDMTPSNSKQHCERKTITTCVRYVGEREDTNMAAVEFKMVTGYSVNMEALGLFIQQHGRDIGLKRVDPPVKGNPLVLYFDKFDGEQRCFDVELKQKVFVDSAKPASIKVYDYYEPGVKSYTAYNTCPPKDENTQDVTLKPAL